MSGIVKNKFGNFLVICLIFLIMAGWIFSGWPRIWQKPAIPPEIQEAQAAAAYQAVGTAVGGTGALSPAWPTHQTNDIALLFVESANETVSLSVPAGFAGVAQYGTGTAGATAATRLAVFWARATSTSMGAPTVAAPGNHAYAVILTYRGVIATGDPFDTPVGGVKTPASTSVTATGVTTTVANALVVVGVTKDLDAVAAFASGQTNGNLTGIAERFDAGTTQGNGGGISVMDGTKGEAGATGNTTITVASSINAFLTIALKPPAGPSITAPGSVAMPDYTLGEVGGYSEKDFSESVHVDASASFTVTVISSELTGGGNTIPASNVRLKTDGVAGTPPTTITCTGFTPTEPADMEYALDIATNVVTATLGAGGTCDIYPTIKVYISNSLLAATVNGTLTFTVF